MICVKCGAEIPDGNLYCEKCGEEINIVPVFEPEVEIQINETMHQIQDDVAEEIEPSPPRRRKKKHHYVFWISILVIFSVIIAVMALTYLYNSPIYQINWGNRLADNAEYDKAIECYGRAIESGDEYVEVYLYMAKCYEMLGQEGKYEEYLLKVIDCERASEDELLIAYTKLIAFYSKAGNYKTINSLLKSCNNDNIVNIYKDFIVSEPVFSHDSGSYGEIIPLKITAPKGETVYYTMDGTTPTTESQVFNSLIFLEQGRYEIRAICVDENGVSSDVIIKEYQIKDEAG